MKTLLLCCAAALIPFAAHAQSSIQDDVSGNNGAPPAALADDPGFATQFRCPESYSDADQRRMATENYLNWASRTHPEWRVDETLNYRTSLLKMNGCSATLDSEVTNLPQVDR
jgi:hypothetical protein